MRGLLLVMVLSSAGAAQQIDTIFPATGRRIVHMTGTSGSVEIKTWSRPEVRVQVRGAGVSKVKVAMTASLVVVTERSLTVQEVEWMPSQAVVTAPPRKVDTTARDTVDRPPTRQGRRGAAFVFTHEGSTQKVVPRPPASVDYTITVPTHGGVIIRGADVEMIVTGSIDTLSLSNVSGSIRASNVRGNIDLSSISGRILVEGASGDLLARTLGGSIAIRGADGDVEAHAVSGSIELVDVRGASVSATTADGGISLGGALPPNGTITLSTMGGPVGLPRSGPCTSIAPGLNVFEVRHSGPTQYRLVLITSAPANSKDAVTCTVRSH